MGVLNAISNNSSRILPTYYTYWIQSRSITYVSVSIYQLPPPPAYPSDSELIQLNKTSIHSLMKASSLTCSEFAWVLLALECVPKTMKILFSFVHFHPSPVCVYDGGHMEENVEISLRSFELNMTTMIKTAVRQFRQWMAESLRIFTRLRFSDCAGCHFSLLNTKA